MAIDRCEVLRKHTHNLLYW